MGLSAPAAQKVSDPIQALFVEKIRDYANKKSATGIWFILSIYQLLQWLHGKQEQHQYKSSEIMWKLDFISM